VAADGSLESGIDGGGLFKEFMMLGRSQLNHVDPGIFHGQYWLPGSLG